VLEQTSALALRDRYPISRGHTLIIPKRHIESVFSLSPEELLDMGALVLEVRRRLAEEFRPDGFTVGVNDGPAAGQTVSHAHVHVIPRYSDDVADPRGGIRWVIPGKAAYWSERT
jgi:diadenosine tetraphosphate (Ap4A) HIT family hydrolase